jgi:hypothetical protein
MLQIREICLSGPNVEDASVKFEPGPNVIAGESDTGKSYLLHCLDYILGADKLEKTIPQAEPYNEVKVEFQNTSGNYLTLVRSISGGDIKVHRSQIDAIDGDGETIPYRRPRGTNKAHDVTSVLFSFAGIKEAMLRKNSDGNLQRLTIRTFLPIIIVNEVAVIEEQSPILGRVGFDETARKRLFAYMLSGKDDSGIVAREKKPIMKARFDAQLALIDDLLASLEQKLRAGSTDQIEDSIEKIDETIDKVSDELAVLETKRVTLLKERDVASDLITKAETQILAIDQLLTRYRLLSEQYTSDLNRLDFVAEGAYYLDQLQTVICPLCGQNMDEKHGHKAVQVSADVYAAGKAEAAKILAQRADLHEAIVSLKQRREAREAERADALANYKRAERWLADIVQPAAASSIAQLRRLNARRLELESVRNTNEQIEVLRGRKAEIEQAKTAQGNTTKQWESLPGTSLRAFCKEVEELLKEWQWEGEGRVEFDDNNFDIKVDGQTRQSHGKGFRAVLYSAFVIALVRFCQKKNLPHPGVVIIDSPLTSYKRQGAKDVQGSDDLVSSGVEAAFWGSLTRTTKDVQIIIVENKEPPASVAAAVHYEWFAGNGAGSGDRIGFIPEMSDN